MASPEADRLAIQSSSPISEESSLALAASPVVERIGIAVKYMLNLVAQSKNAQNNKSVTMGMKLGSKLITEMMTDLQDNEIPPAIMELYLKQIASMFYWTATGEKDPTLPWPSDFEV